MKARAWLTGLLTTMAAFLIAAPAFAADGGEGLYGKADDKVITNFGFGLMIFFTLLVTGLSLAQHLLQKRKQRSSPRDRLAAMTVQADQIIAAHEGWQRPGAEEQWSDSFYFGGGDGRGLAFYSRIGRRPNEEVVEGALGVWLPQQGFLLSFAREQTVELSIACGAALFECLEPLRSWELLFEGHGRLFERAEHVATRREDYREVHLTGSLVFTAWGEPLSFRSGLSTPVASAHYEQPGSLSGTITVDGQRRQLAGNGMRDHSWGVRDWQRVPYWRWFGFVSDPDNFVMLNNVGLEDGGETAGGFLMRDGELAPIVSGQTDRT